jgi:hypothetical protein
MVEAKYLQTCKDNLEAILLFISNNAGQFPRHTASKHSNERMLYAFWERRTVAENWIRFVETDPGVADLYSEIESLYQQSPKLEDLLLFINENNGCFPEKDKAPSGNYYTEEGSLYNFWRNRKGMVITDPSVAELYSEIESLYQQKLEKQSPKSSLATKKSALYQRRSRGRAQLVELLQNKQNVTDPHQSKLKKFTKFNYVLYFSFSHQCFFIISE